ncbi:MAG: DUF6941 family protein, partial [Longimicrobiales bacterium]
GRTVLEVRGDLVPQGPPGQTVSTNQILTLNNLQLEKPGGHTFLVFVNNDLKAEVPLGVEVAPSPLDAPGNGPA